ncbi:MAG: DNA polymerase IV [Nitrososphaerales archaeon]
MSLGTKDRIIFHIDFDYFFAQCEELRRPEIKGKPIVVCVYSGRTEESGAVSTANYEARKYNVKSGIPIKLAKKRLKGIPEVVFLSVDHDYYREMSDKAMNIIQGYADKFELVGVDETFIDVSERLNHDFTLAEELAFEIKQQLKNELKLSCSIGIAPNKLLAKISSDFKKPDGLTIVNPGEIEKFLVDMNVSKIIGVGKKTEERLNRMGVKTVGDLAKLDIYKLTKEFGKKNGIYLFNASRGIDKEPVTEGESVTQISRIVTLKKSTNLVNEMLYDLEYLCKSVHRSATDQNFSFKSVGIMLILDDLSAKSKSRSLKSPSTNYNAIFKTAETLLEEGVSESKLMVRRLGVKVSELISSKGQDTLSKFME